MTIIAPPLIVDRSHPIMVGIFDCYLFDATNFGKNLANNGVRMTPNSGAKFTNTIDGIAGACAAGSNFSFPDHGNTAAGDCTIRCRFVTSATPGGGFTTLFDKGVGTSEYRCYLNTSSAISFLNIGNTGTGIASGTLNGVGLVNDLVVTRTIAAGGHAIAWLNGALLTDGGAGGAGGTTASTSNLILAVDGTNTNGAFQYTVFQTWLRALSQNEVLQLFFNPRLGLKTTLQFVPMMTTVSAGSSVNFRRTLSPLGTRAGSRQSQAA